MSPGVKERLEVVYDIVKTTFHWGFIPVVLYLGKTFDKHGYLLIFVLCIHSMFTLQGLIKN